MNDLSEPPDQLACTPPAPAAAPELLSLCDPFLQLDAQWRIVCTNEKLARLCGLPQEALLHRALWDALADWGSPDSAAGQACRRCMQERCVVAFEAGFGGGPAGLEATASPMGDGGIAVFFRDATGLRRADEALRRSEAKFHSVFEQSAVGMARVTLPGGRWVDVNETFCRMVGRTREELLALTWPDITHPDDVTVGMASFRRMAAGELDACSVEKRYLQPDGTVVWARLTLSLVRDREGRPEYEVAIIEDIRERMAAEMEAASSKRQLEAQRLRLQTIIDTIPTGLLMLDERGATVLENDEWRRTWCADGNGAEAAGCRALHPDTGSPVPPAELPQALSLAHGTKTRDVVLDIEHPGRERATVVVSSAPILDPGGRVTGAVAANMDITELRRAQARLQEADARKDEFLVMLSHELRNPLAPIRTALQILDRAEPSGPQALRARETIRRQVVHLTGLVDELLDVGRIARGKVELRRSLVDLAALARRTSDDYTAVMRERGLALSVVADDEPVFVDGDETRLAQVLGNLLSNAAKFTPRGGSVAIRTGRREGRAVLSVRDTGVGMAPQLLPTIFEAFVQAKQDLARGDGGLGLGLAIVRGLVNLHGGTVQVSSALGEGTEFSIHLPVTDAPPGLDAQPVAPAVGEARRRRVLVVDDNVDAAESLAELVRLLGHEVDVAYDGAEAVALGQSARHDVVLCDIGLPRMDGYAVAQALKPKLHDQARLIALSGYARPEDIARSRGAGFDAHIAKPPDPAEIERLLGA